MKKLRISEYIQALKTSGLFVSHNISDADLSKEIECLTYDSREITSNAMFICKGAHFKADYIDKAFLRYSIHIHTRIYHRDK